MDNSPNNRYQIKKLKLNDLQQNGDEGESKEEIDGEIERKKSADPLVDEQKRLKNKSPGPQVLSSDRGKRSSIIGNVDQIELEETHLNCRQRLDKFLSTNDRLTYFEIFIDLLAGASFVYYFVCTYEEKLYKSLNYIDYPICVLFIVEHIINIILAHHSSLYLISLESLINFVTEIPPLFWPFCDNYHLDTLYRFINITRVLRVLRLYRIMDLFQSGEKDVNKQILRIIVILAVVIFVWAGIIQMLDMGQVESELMTTWSPTSRAILLLRRHYHHYLYFIVVSLTTVGYGEIMPITYLGKVMIMFLVVVILVVVPDQTNELIDLVAAQSFYARRSYKGSPDIFHIVIIGEIDLESLKSFCIEFFHKDHGSKYRHAVIIRNEVPSKEMELFLNEKENANFLIYLQGNPMNNEDLMRADILNARACIILTNKNSKDPFSGDHQSLLLSLYVKKFYYNTLLNSKEKINHPFRLCIQLNKPESPAHYFGALQSVYKKEMVSDQILVIEPMKMSLLSKSCLTPGIIALLSNLVMSSGDSLQSGNEPEWLREYGEGREHEIYRVNLEGNLLNKNFGEIAIEIYEDYQAIPIAIEISYDRGVVVKLNPQSKESISEILRRGVDNDINMTASSKANNFVGFNKSDPRVSIYIICPGKEVSEAIMKKEHDSNPNNVNTGKGNPLNRKMSYRALTMHANSTLNVLKLKGNYTKSNTLVASESSDEEGKMTTNNVEGDNNNNELIEEADYENYYTVDKIENNYYNTNEIMHQSIKDRDDIVNHVIICGIHPEIIHFILPLRANYLPEKSLKWIVILSPSLPQELHDALSKFPKIIFIQGSPLQPENLFRANITSADIAVILSSGFSKAPTAGDGGAEASLDDKEEMLDAETIFIYKAIKKINKEIKIMTELLVTKNIEFLLTARNLQKLYVNGLDDNNPIYEHTSVFASGEVYLPSVVDKITCQSFYNTNLLSIFNLILSGENTNKSKHDQKIDKLFGLIGSNLFLIPNEAKNESYSDMYNRLVNKHSMVPLGLYRKNLVENFYYIYTNPKKTTLIRDTDLVFVLSSTEQMIALTDKIKYNNSISNNLTSSGIFSDQQKDKGDGKPPSLFKVIENQINKNEEELKDKPAEQNEKSDENTISLNQIKPKVQNFTMKKTESSKHAEIDNLQKRIDNSFSKLKKIHQKCHDVLKEINNFVVEEVNSELLMYIAKSENKS